MSNHLDKLPLLDLVNRKTLAEYIHRQELRQLQECSIEDKVWRVYCLLKFLDWKDARAITKADLEDYIIHRRKTVAPRTLQGDMIELRIFFRFLDPAKETEFFPEDERIQKPKIKFPDPLTREDIEALAAACDTMRDRALVMFLWDTGCRIDEALSRNVGDIRFDQYGGMVKVSGKTGERELWLIDCVPALQAWVNAHPQKTDPDAPLFVTYTRYGFGSRRLNVRTVQNLCKVLKKRSGVTGRVHPHGFRHARATDRAKEGFTEMELRIMFGWSKTSAMPATYIHLSGADVKKKILQKAGLEEKEPEPGSRPLDPIKCPRCGLLNPKGFYTCSRCNSPLSADAMREIGIVQNLMSNPDDLIAYAEWRKSQLIK
ncbi:tyrosine-type recombinase/integrase [Methanoregula sp.]|uniref:tyrosine-type recombinase/integrase n=1 Tax=Methanoregula sp. TaxID=2052170 RepID=UPI003FD75362